LFSHKEFAWDAHKQNGLMAALNNKGCTKTEKKVERYFKMPECWPAFLNY